MMWKTGGYSAFDRYTINVSKYLPTIFTHRFYNGKQVTINKLSRKPAKCVFSHRIKTRGGTCKIGGFT